MPKRSVFSVQIFRRILALTLCLALFFSGSQLPALAELYTPSYDIEERKALHEAGETAGEVTVLAELTDRREENVKQFRMSDRSIRAIVYAQPVHYQEDGEWKEINNSLRPDGTGRYVNTASDFEVSLAGRSNSPQLIGIRQGDYALSWSYVQPEQIGSEDASMRDELTASVLEIEEPPVPVSDYAEKTVEEAAQAGIGNTIANVRYRNVQPHTDLSYQVVGKSVKENIIVNARQSRYRYEFLLQAEGLTLEVDEAGGAITADDRETGKTIFQIPAAVMYDAAGADSTAVGYELEEIGRGRYRLSIEADAAWINADGRQFPVSIDPVITTQTKQSVHSTFVCSGSDYRNMNMSTRFEWIVGNLVHDYYECWGLIQFDLPSLNPGDMVVDAQMSMVLRFKSAVDESAVLEIDAHRATSAWNSSSVTWNTKPSYEGTVYDYDTVTEADPSEGYTQKLFNITKMVKKWYAGEANHGILLKPRSAAVKTKAQFIPERYNNYPEGYYPYVAIAYRNNKGVEPYWDYSSASIGTAGGLSVNRYSGNPVLTRTDAETTGLRMPVSLSHVYNGYMAGENFTQNSRYPNHMKPYAGKGFKLNLQQTVFASSVYGLSGTSQSQWPYVYTDGDGTEHYFMKTSDNRYKDEDGLGLELKVISGGYTIEDDKGNQLSFNAQGFLSQMKDANGNTAVLTYSGGYLTTITDGVGHTITLEHEGDYLSAVTDPSGRRTTYSYDNGRLVTVTDPEGRVSSYSYDSDQAIIRAQAADGSRLVLSYTSRASGKQVSALQEYGTDQSAGQKISFDRSVYNVTKVRSAGVDGIFGNSDDRITRYLFDNAGRTTGTQVCTTDGRLLGAYSQELTGAAPAEGGSDIKKLNRISRSAAQGGYADNPITNGSFESLSGWTQAPLGTAQQTIAQNPNHRYFGKKSLQITSTACSDGSAAQVYQEFGSTVLRPGETYTASVYVKLPGNLTKNACTNGWGACLGVFIYGSSQGTLYQYSEFLTKATDTSINNGWRRVSYTFTVPSDATKVRIAMLVYNSTGTAYFEGAQVEAGDSASPYNMVGNSGFELSPDIEWTAHDLANEANRTSAGSISTEAAHSGTHSLKLVGAIDRYPYYSQAISVSGSAQDTYIISAWAKADAVPNRDENRDFKIDLYIEYADGTYTWKNARFNATVSEWQFLSYAFTLSSTGNENKTPILLRIDLSYEHQANPVYFDDIQLIRDESQSYTYDSDGNLISVVDNAEQKSTMVYSNHNLIRETDARGYDFSYVYDTKHNLAKATTQNGVTYNYAYNSYGEPIGMNIKDKDGTKAIRTEVGYTITTNGVAFGAYADRLYDQHGRLTSYSYAMDSGLLQSVTDAAGITTEYTYGSGQRLQSVSQDGITVSYAYDAASGALASITHNGFQYTFERDVFGNLLNTKAGGHSLASYVYGAGNGLLQSLTYGNGLSISYGYDEAGRMTSQSINGTERYRWKYGTAGEVQEHLDLAQELSYRSDYDSIGRFIRRTVFDTSLVSRENGRLYSTEYGYDVMNNVTKIANEAFGEVITQNYTYGKDNLPLTHSATGGLSVTYGFDGWNRLTSQLLNTTTAVRTDYGYAESARGSSWSTTELVTEIIGNVAYRYTRDVRGNITKIEEGVRSGNTGTNYATKVLYRYDNQNQLIWESSLYSGQTHAYTYLNGNLRKEQVWNRFMTAPTTENANTSYDYGYGSGSGWNDVSSFCRGYPVMRDSLGNPTSYRDGISMTWSGRQMMSAKHPFRSSETAQYEYGADGLRLKKTYAGVTTTYEYANGQLLAEKRSNGIVLHYTYDSLGALSSLRYTAADGTTTTYYVRCNHAGDVEQLYNTDGTLAARYSYDAWGQTVRVKNANGVTITDANHIANVNPIRYRGYYYDAETGFYYVSSRYYDPEVGRFINADDIAYLGMGGLTSYNLFAYCGNNPVMGYDPYGTFDWSSFGKGAGWLAIGITAICVGVSVLTCGVAAPAMMAVAAVTVTAGALTAVNGVSELGEAATGHNFVRDDVFRGNKKAYDVYSNTTAAVAEIGTAICGGWTAKNAPRIKAYNNIQNYNYTDTISDVTHMSRPYANSVLTQKQVIKYGKMTKDSFGYVFSAMGSVNGKEKLWRLGINTAKGLVWHWGHGF